MSNRSKLLLLASPCLAALLVFGPTLLPVQSGDTASNVATPRSPTGEVAPLRVVLTLCGVLALAATTLLLWRRLSLAATPGAPRRTMRLKETLRLSPRNRLHLIAVGDRLLVVGEGERGVSCVMGAVEDEEMPELADVGPVTSGSAAVTTAPDKAVVLTPAPARARQRVADEDEGAVPRDLVDKVGPRASRGMPQSPAEFRNLLERVRAEVAP